MLSDIDKHVLGAEHAIIHKGHGIAFRDHQEKVIYITRQQGVLGQKKRKTGTDSGN